MGKIKKKKQKKPMRLSYTEKQKFIKEFHKLADREITQIRNKTGDEISRISIVALAIAARDEFDFGKQRILRLERRFLEQFNAMVDGRITLQDIETAMLEEVGIDFNKLEEELEALK